jgi:hypothetical protein
MRTTVTLDPDLAAKVRSLAHERGVSFKDALNSTLRAGLTAGSSAGSTRPYRLPSAPMKLRAGIDLVHALRFAGELEDEEAIRKLELRK